MCGYIGSISNVPIDNNKLLKENERIICRGPDEKEHQNFKTENLFYNIVFNRLSILELTNNGSQPIFDNNKNFMLIFNGEIFNYIELKKYLEKYKVLFKSSNSDTEVLLYGLINEKEKFIPRLIGQFSFVFCDLKNNEILISRDRTGQKPLFFSNYNGSLMFSSNLSSLSNLTNSIRLNEESINEFLSIGVVTSPNTIYKNINKVEPGSYIKFKFESNKFYQINKFYWKPDDFIREEIRYNNDELKKIVNDSIEIRLRSDVPIATFCSGGLDSTMIIKTINDLGYKVPTFSVVNENQKYDESEYINQVVEKFKTKHFNSLIKSDQNILKLNIELDAFDEPYADASNFPSIIISSEISKYFKVAISGDGGDEVFFGYKRFNDEVNIKKLNSGFIKFLISAYPPVFGSGNKLNKRSSDYKTSYASYFEDLKLLQLFNIKNNFSLAEKYLNNSQNKIKNLLAFENKFYLAEMMNLKVDRTSMYNSLEVRSPFVDHRIIEYILSCKTESLPYLTQKEIIKNELSTIFNNEFLNRKKMGFVFDLENLIFPNKKEILKMFSESNLMYKFSLKKINSLFNVKSRMNAIRIYKLLILNKHFK